jgi:23S rRNA pseudouridine1911/1915/1917 synthase
MAPLDILYEDNHLLAINKPAGLVTMGVAEDRPSLLKAAKEYIKQRYRKPGNVYLGAMSRLDAPVTGVILFARTSKAAARLTEQFRTHAVEKAYWAIVEGAMEPAQGRLVDWIAADERHRQVRIVGRTIAGAKEARLSYRRIKALPRASLVEIALETGRKHQIRVQFAACGHPVVGDRKYGSRTAFPEGIALHARRLVITHPVKQNTTIELVAPVPAAWKRYGIMQ